MALRAVSVARLLTPLAVLVPIIAAPLGAVWLAPRSQVLALVVLVAGLMAVAASGHFTYGVRTSVLAAILTWVALVVSFPVFFVISINTSICGKYIDAAWAWLPQTAGVLAFFAVGGWVSWRAALAGAFRSDMWSGSASSPCFSPPSRERRASARHRPWATSTSARPAPYRSPRQQNLRDGAPV